MQFYSYSWCSYFATTMFAIQGAFSYWDPARLCGMILLSENLILFVMHERISMDLMSPVAWLDN